MTRTKLKIAALVFLIVCAQTAASSAQDFRAADNRLQFFDALFQTGKVNFRDAAFQKDENAPKRIVFAKGKSSAVLTGTLRRTKTIDDVHYYVVRAKAGQSLILRVTAASGSAAVTVQNSGGEMISEGIDDRFDGKIPATGDYVIHVFNPGNGNFGSTRYTLTVSVK